jgi:hypothetical protein
MKEKRIGLLIGLVMIFLALSYSLYTKYEREKFGIITVARIDRLEPAEQGSALYVTIFFRDHQYNATVNTLCSSCKGKFHFVKIFPDDPTRNPLLYEDNPVPDCIISNEKYYGGWKTFPTCDNKPTRQ